MSIIALTSDTLAGTATAGQVEYSSPIFAATPIATQRGVVPSAQFYRLNSDLVGANVNTAQNIFGVGVTLSSSTVYEFESLIVLSKSAGTTSHSMGFGFGGSATINNIIYEAVGGFVVSSTPSGQLQIASATNGLGSIANSSANTVVTTAIINAGFSLAYHIRGTVSINAGGTFIPQYTLSAAPGGAYSTVAGSYILIYPIGAAGANTNVGTWA